jgi:hypothetical protein
MDLMRQIMRVCCELCISIGHEYDFRDLFHNPFPSGFTSVFNAFTASTSYASSALCNKNDLYAIVAHELGHTMGLNPTNPRLRVLSADTGVVDTTIRKTPRATVTVVF